MEAGPTTNTETVQIGLMAPLGAAIGELAERDLDWREPQELTQILDAAPRLQSQLDSLTAMAVVSGIRAGVNKQQRHDYRTVYQMVADRTGADPAKVRRLGRLGSWIEEFGELADAWRDGVLYTEHVDVIRRVADNGRTHSALFRDQHLFVEWVHNLDFTDFTYCCHYWVNANDPDGEVPKEQTSKTYFRANKQADGAVKLDGFLDPLTGAAFMTALQQETQKLFRNKQGTDTAPVQLDLGKRGAEALMNLVIRGHKRDDGGETVPLINIVMSQSVAEDLLDRLARSSGETDIAFPIAFDNIDGRCELIDGTPLHPNLVMHTLSAARFQRHILDANERVLDSSVTARVFTQAQKHALRIQARGRCQKRGCDAPFPWLEADHHIPHSRGGPTTMANGNMLCKPDNLAKSNHVHR